MSYLNLKKCPLFLVAISLILMVAAPVLAATTSLHIVKYANDRTTILSEKTLSYQEMRDSLPVLGDGFTHYYHQGPVFVDHPDAATQERMRWNPLEDTNVQEKDMGAVKGTNVKDLCNLVGGMVAGDTLVIRASDGMTKEFAYKNVYSPPSRQGPMVITWYCSGSTFSACNGPYPDSGYADGMRLVFFADTSVNPWREHVFGNFDWHESADPEYWYYYQNGDEKYPTTTGLSVKYVSEIQIYSSQSSSAVPAWGWGGGMNNSAGAVPADDVSRFGYSGSELMTYAQGILNGTIRLLYPPDRTPYVANNRIREYPLSVEFPRESNLTLARLYVYVSKSHGIQSYHGVIPSIHTGFNGVNLDPDKVYIDTDGDEHRNVSATYAYDVLSQVKRNGTHTLTIRNMDFDQSEFIVDDVMLMIVYEEEKGVPLQYWINEGCDVIFSEPGKGIFPRDATTSVAFNGQVNISADTNADLILVSTDMDALNTTEHAVKFNDATMYNSFDNLSDAGTLRIRVTPWLNLSANTAAIESSIRKMDSDYLVNRNAILLIQQNPDAIQDKEGDMTNLTSYQPGIGNASLIDNSSPTQVSTPAVVLLHTNPEGALIFVDGIYLGKTTPYSLNIDTPGQHRIRMDLDGFVSKERDLSIINNTSICEELYSDVHSTKGRSDEQIMEREKTRHGGLYINSRPNPAIIFIDGTRMPQRTPAVLNGLKEGTYTVRLSFEQSDPLLREKSDIRFEEKEVYVHPYCIVPVDVAANSSPLREMIIDSRELRGEPFTVNGNILQKTIPDKITTPVFDAFITVFHNQSYISYTLPVTINEDRYLVIKPRQHHDLDIFVDSKPRGAEVFIDGFRTGLSTPYSFTNISDGPHRIMVSKNGYIPQESSIDLLYTPVPISVTNISFFLEEYPNGFLRVESNPQGADITLDGMDTGEVTPFLFSSIPTGLHSVMVSGNNLTQKYPDTTVNALHIMNISADLFAIMNGSA